MANTERIKVLQLVRNSKNAVRNARFDIQLTVEERTLLERLFADLDRLEDDLILGILDEQIEAMENTSKKLETIAESIRKQNEKLSAIGDMIDKSAKGLKMLADITAKAGSFGVL